MAGFGPIGGGIGAGGGGSMPDTSAGVAAIITDETGTGLLVYNTAPTLAGAVIVSDSINDATISAADNITLTQAYGGF